MCIKTGELVPCPLKGVGTLVMGMCPSPNQTPLVPLETPKQYYYFTTAFEQHLEILKSGVSPATTGPPGLRCLTRGVPLTASSSCLHPCPSFPG